MCQCRFISCDNVPPGGMLLMMEAIRFERKGYMGNLCTFLSMCCEPKAALKNINKNVLNEAKLVPEKFIILSVY